MQRFLLFRRKKTYLQDNLLIFYASKYTQVNKNVAFFHRGNHSNSRPDAGSVSDDAYTNTVITTVDPVKVTV